MAARRRFERVAEPRREQPAGVGIGVDRDAPAHVDYERAHVLQTKLGHFARNLSTKVDAKPYYVTTPIFYPNAGMF